MLMLLLALFVSVYLELKHYLCILKLSMAISVWTLPLPLSLFLPLSLSLSLTLPLSLPLSLFQVIFVLFGVALIGISVYVLNDAIIVKFVSRGLVIAGSLNNESRVPLSSHSFYSRLKVSSWFSLLVSYSHFRPLTSIVSIRRNRSFRRHHL